MMTANQVATRLAAQAAAVAVYLLPNGKRRGKEWCVGSLQGEPGKSLKVVIAGSKQGLWSDFASKESGDMLALWSQTRSISIAVAMQEAKKWCGVFEPNLVVCKPAKIFKPLTKQLTALNKTSEVAKYLLEQRKLTWETCQRFQVSESKDYIVLPYLLEEKTLQIKHINIHRDNNKKQIFVEPNSQPCLFGWQALPSDAREITLTEGEIDAMTLAQYGIPALSLPFGGGTGNKHQWLEFEFDRLSIFDKIYLCFDNDAVGKQAAAALVDRLGRHRCFIVNLPHKDANECLQQNISVDEIKQCFEDAATCDPEELKCASTYKTAVANLFQNKASNITTGYLPPWQTARELGLEFRPNELSIWTGINGHGKSQLLGYLLLHAMKQGARVCIASLELKPEATLFRLTKQATACDMPQPELVEATQEWFADKLWIYDFVGTASTERLLEVFLYARQRYGVDKFLIDSLVKCSIPEDDYNGQQKFIDQLCTFKNKHDCHIHLIAHPRKGADEFRVPGKLDIRGSASITDLADNCFSIWRNKAVVGNQENCILRCDKQRHGDWEGQLNLWFDPKTYQYLDSPTAEPYPIIY